MSRYTRVGSQHGERGYAHIGSSRPSALPGIPQRRCPSCSQCALRPLSRHLARFVESNILTQVRKAAGDRACESCYNSLAALCCIDSDKQCSTSLQTNGWKTEKQTENLFLGLASLWCVSVSCTCTFVRVHMSLQSTVGTVLHRHVQAITTLIS
jgi:hypothetical protein